MIRKAVEFLPKQIFRAYADYQNQKEYQAQSYSLNERTIEYGFVFNSLRMAWPKTVLDIGTGATALPHVIRSCGYEVSAIDNIQDYWPRGLLTRALHNRHYHVINDDILASKINRTFDLVLCISTLEHIPDAQRAVGEMVRLTKSGGHIVLTFPYNEKSYCEDVYKLKGSAMTSHPGYVGQAFARENISAWCKEFGLSVAQQEYWRFWTGEFWTVGTKLARPEISSASEPHQISCVLLKKD